MQFCSTKSSMNKMQVMCVCGGGGGGGGGDLSLRMIFHGGSTFLHYIVVRRMQATLAVLLELYADPII